MIQVDQRVMLAHILIAFLFKTYKNTFYISQASFSDIFGYEDLRKTKKKPWKPAFTYINSIYNLTLNNLKGVKYLMQASFT